MRQFDISDPDDFEEAMMAMMAQAKKDAVNNKPFNLVEALKKYEVLDKGDDHE